MKRAEFRRLCRQVERDARGEGGAQFAACGHAEWGGEQWVVWTEPGCERPEHAAEVVGAALALDQRGGVPWEGRTAMDCGCQLWLVPGSAIKVQPR